MGSARPAGVKRIAPGDAGIPDRAGRVRTPPTMLLRTKLILPEIKARVIDRDRLRRALQENEDRKIILVIADAGYGKTTLIGQWMKKCGYRRVFYGLSEEDSNFDLFLSHLIAGFEGAIPGITGKVRELIADNRDLKDDIGLVMGTIVNELQEHCRERLYLILDDYHALAGSSVVHRALDYFIENLPARVHVVIASRVQPPLDPLIKWRSKQMVFELKREDLVFTGAEVKELISGVYRLMLPGAELERIEQYTEGWVTGIQLILQTAGLHRMAVKDTLNGYLEAERPLFEYFASEVLAGEAEPDRDFLAQSSVLECLTPRACNAVLGRKDARPLLRKLARRHVFLFEVKEDEYQLHHLFRKYLDRRLENPAVRARLHARAARFYGREGLYDLGIKHYLAAGEYRQAGAMILRSIHGDAAGRVSGNFDAVQLRKYLDELPSETLERLPTLLVIKGTLSRDAGEHEKAKGFYATAERKSRAAGDLAACAHSRSETALLHWLEGRPRRALATLRKAARGCPPSAGRMRLHIFNLLGLVWQELSDLPRARAFLRRARSLAGRLDIFYDKIVIGSNLATISLQEGEIRRAYETCRPLIAPLGGRYYYKIGVIYANAGRAALDFGDLEWAESCLRQGWDVCRRYEDRVSFGTLNHGYGILHMHKRQWEFARRHFEEARKVFQLLRWKRMESSVLRNIGLGLRLQGDLNKSLRLVEEAGRLLEGPDPNRTAHAAFLLADRALIEFGLGRYRESGRTIAGCEKLARARRWHLGRLYGRLVRALIALKTGRKKAARDLVNGLFDLAREKGYHGILGLELRHQPELLSFVRGLPGHRAYLDRFPRYYAAEPPGLFLRFFGRMRIEDADRNELRPAWPTEKARSLFAFLVLNRARNLTRDEVLDALWPGSKRTRAQENLRTTAYRMRRALAQIKTSGPDKDAPFSRRQGRYFLLPDLAIESDVDEHDRLMKLCDMTRSEDEQVSLLKQLAEAGREPLLPDIYDGWADARRSAFREQRLKVLGRIIAILSRRNDHSACAGYCAQYLKLEPLSEETAHTLMFSLKNLGRISEVKKAYQALARKLREELKCPPAPETKRFYRELLK